MRHIWSLVQMNFDENTYTCGSIRRHNVVAARCLRRRTKGPVSALSFINPLMESFPNVKTTILVGIGDGIPSASADIRLGDVVVGWGGNDSQTVIHLESGKTLPHPSHPSLNVSMIGWLLKKGSWVNFAANLKRCTEDPIVDTLCLSGAGARQASPARPTS